MRAVIFWLFLRRFSSWKYRIPLILEILLPIIKYIVTGLWDEAIFSWLLNTITGKGDLMDIVNLLFIIIPLFLIAGTLFLMYREAKREYQSDYLANTLKKMHERVIELVSERLKRTKNISWIEETIPELVHKWGIIDIGDWNNTLKHWQQRLKKPIPSKSHASVNQWFALASRGEEIKKELLDMKQWGEDDIYQLGEWLDSQGHGLTDLREHDGKWQALNNSVEVYRRDNILRIYVNQHIKYSWGYCNVLLIQKLVNPNNRNIQNKGNVKSVKIMRMLVNILIGNPVSKEMMNEGLDATLDSIRGRQKRIERFRSKDKEMAKG